MTSSPLPSPTPRGEQAARLLEEALDRPGGTSERAPPPSVEEIAPRFPDLEIHEILGAGGMGVVYRARHKRLDRLVALKILPEALGRDPQFAERFAREARVLARLDHPHIVRVHDFGVSHGLYYLLLEFVDGASLRQVMGTGGLSPTEALAIVPQICAALQYAHDQGVVHRDIKPENVLLDRRGQVKIADFGLAKIVGHTGIDPSVTATGQVMGTPHYMAPEQYRTPQEVDHRADIFSLGVVFYEMLTGELPVGRFKAPSEARDLDARIDHIVLRALERERALRYQRAEEIRTDVSRLSEAPPPAPAQARHFGLPPAGLDDPVPSRRGRGFAIAAAVAIPLGFAAAATAHALWGGVLRGTQDAFEREALKGALAGVVWFAGAVCGLVAALRGARAPEPRRLHKVGILLLVVNLTLLPLLGAYVADEVQTHSGARGATAFWPSDLTVRGLSPGIDPRPFVASIERTWRAHSDAHEMGDVGWRSALGRYVAADREALWGLGEVVRQGRLHGIGVLTPPDLGARPSQLRLRRVELDASGRRASVRVLSDWPAPPGGWEFPMALDADGEWRFAIGEVVRVEGD